MSKKSNEKNREEMRDDHDNAKPRMTADNQPVPEVEEQESGEMTAQQGEAVSEEERAPQSDDEEPDNEEIPVLTKDEIEELRQKAEEHDSLLNQLLRTRADFSNYQKRMQKDLKSARDFAIQELVCDLLPELDNFERALKHAENSDDLDKFVEGVRLTETQILKILDKYGVTPIEPIGKPFDPNLHEAIVEEENNDHPHHTVTGEFQKGFLLKERVIRPSKVKVSKRTVDETESETDEVSDDEVSW
ncbi:MAG: nucleotide exchange factor GrpE [Candidatus Scalindua sp.]|nr:nucleotide exchange factor GrpE [Candidatus Scalindua sp.]